MTTDLTKLDAANTALQRDPKAAASTKRFGQSSTEAIHAVDEAAQTNPIVPTDPVVPTDPIVPTEPTEEYLVKPGQSIQAVVDKAPKGSRILLDIGPHRPEYPVDVKNQNALRVEGMGGVGYNEDDQWGTVIWAPPGGKPIFVDAGDWGVKHAGPKFAWLNLRSDRADAVGWLLRRVNHVKIRDCSVKGLFASAVDGDVPVTDPAYDQGDHAYNALRDVTVVNKQPNARAFSLGDGFWWLENDVLDLSGTSPTAVVNLRGNLNMTNVKTNNAGTHLYSSGNSCTISGCHFEQAPYTGAFIVVCEKGQNPLYGAGCRHKFLGNTFTPHDDAYGPGAKIVRFGSGTYGNNLPRAYNNTAYDKAGSFVNEGADGDTVFLPLA